MKNYVLIALICSLQKGEISVFPVIFDEFKGLIYHYSNKLCEDDSAQELTVFLLELLCDIDVSRFEPDKSDTLKRYIAVCLRNKYIEISKKYQIYSNLSKQLTENAGFGGMQFVVTAEIKDALSCLTEKQRLAVVCKYVYGISDVQTAKIMGISRQAVNRTVNRALKKLKEYYEI